MLAKDVSVSSKALSSLVIPEIVVRIHTLLLTGLTDVGDCGSMQTGSGEATMRLWWQSSSRNIWENKAEAINQQQQFGLYVAL